MFHDNGVDSTTKAGDMLRYENMHILNVKEATPLFCWLRLENGSLVDDTGCQHLSLLSSRSSLSS
jgi:hypothetical protein